MKKIKSQSEYDRFLKQELNPVIQKAIKMGLIVTKFDTNYPYLLVTLSFRDIKSLQAWFFDDGCGQFMGSWKAPQSLINKYKKPSNSDQQRKVSNDNQGFNKITGKKVPYEKGNGNV